MAANWQEGLEVRLARMEERQIFLQQTLEALGVHIAAVQQVKHHIGKQDEALADLQRQFSHAKGMALVLSGVVAFVAGWLPDFFLKK